MASLSKPVDGGISEYSQLLQLSHPSTTNVFDNFTLSTPLKTDKPKTVVLKSTDPADWFKDFVLDKSPKRVPPTPDLYPDTLDVSTVPSSPSIQSASTTPTMAIAVRNTAVTPRPSPPPVVPVKLLDLDGSTGSVEILESGAMGDLVGLSASFTTTPTSLGDLAGLEFQFPTPLKVAVAKDLLAEPIIPVVTPTPSPEMEVVTKPVVVKDPPEEAIVFQGRRHTRRSTPSQIKLVDPESADRAFRMFSQAIKEQHK